MSVNKAGKDIAASATKVAEQQITREKLKRSRAAYKRGVQRPRAHAFAPNTYGRRRKRVRAAPQSEPKAPIADGKVATKEATKEATKKADSSKNPCGCAFYADNDISANCPFIKIDDDEKTGTPQFMCCCSMCGRGCVCPACSAANCSGMKPEDVPASVPVDGGHHPGHPDTDPMLMLPCGQIANWSEDMRNFGPVRFKRVPCRCPMCQPVSNVASSARL